jgi:hypothetical protein
MIPLITEKREEIESLLTLDRGGKGEGFDA